MKLISNKALRDFAALHPEADAPLQAFRRVVEKGGFDNFAQIKFWKTPTQKCATQNDQCVPYSRWVSDYIGVMGGQ